MRTLITLMLLAACAPASTVPQGSIIPTGDAPIAAFYCGISKQCWTTEAECVEGHCSQLGAAWCAVYATGVDSYPERLMCGVERDDCSNLLGKLSGALAHNHGECIRRESLRP